MSDWNTVPALSGHHVRLEPLHPSHADGLRTAADDGELWALWYTSVPAPAAVDSYINAALAMQDEGRALPFAVRNAQGDIVGSTRYYDLDPATPRLQIGYTWYAKQAQRTLLNTETKSLLLAHAFESMGCIAVGFETSTCNQVSRAAIARLGAQQDGVLRNHRRHADGSVRDTVAFSIIDTEWPQVKRLLQDRLTAREQHYGTHV